MDYGTTSEVHRELLDILRDELSFYQSLFILIDRQKDLLKYDRDEELVKVFSEIDRYAQRIQESEARLKNLARQRHEVFALAMHSDDIRHLVESIGSLVEKNLAMVKENEDFVAIRHEKIQKELQELQQSVHMVTALRSPNPEPQLSMTRPDSDG